MKTLDLRQDTLLERVLVENCGGRSFRGALDASDQHPDLAISQPGAEVNDRIMPTSGLALLRGDRIVRGSP